MKKQNSTEAVVPSTKFLKQEKVIVRFLPRPTKEIKDPKHIAYGGKLEGCYDYVAPPRLRKDKLKNILTTEEKNGLEYLMGLDLSVYGDYWRGYKRDGLFPIALGKDDKVLDLTIPEDYIIWKVLLGSELVANSRKQVRQKGSYKYVLIEEGDTVKQEANKVNLKAKAYELFGILKSNPYKMRYVLREFGKHTHKGQKLEFLKGEIGKIIESSDIQLFIKVVEDEMLDIKVMLLEGQELGVIKVRSGQYTSADGQSLADKKQEPTLQNVCSYLGSALGQEARLGIEAKIKNARE